MNNLRLTELLILCLIISCASSNKKSNKEYNNNPKVVKFKVYCISYTANDEAKKKERDSSFSNVDYYNKKGKLVRSESRNPNSELSYWIDNKYDKSNRLVNKTFYYLDSTINYSNDYYYNKRDKVSRMVVKNKKVTKEVKYYYDSNGNMTGLSNYQISQFFNSALARYNVKNQRIEQKEFDKNKNLIRLTRYKYYKTNKVKTVIYYKGNSNEISNEIYYEYDKRGNITKKKNYKIINNDTILKFQNNTVFKYDKYKNVIESTTSTSNGDSICISTYEYIY